MFSKVKVSNGSLMFNVVKCKYGQAGEVRIPLAVLQLLAGGTLIN